MKHLPVIILLAILMVSATGVSKSKTSAISAQEERKADYIYLEALRQRAQGTSDDAIYELLYRASELNPADVEIRKELAPYLLQFPRPQVKEAFESLRDYYNAYPGDYYEAGTYGLMCERLGSTEEARKVWRELHTRYPEKIELTFKYADYLASHGDSTDRARAIEIYDSLEVIDGNSIPVSTRKIQIYYAENDTQAIINEVNRLLRSAPRSVEYNVFAGEIYAAVSMNDSAIKYFNSACEIDPSNGIANYSRAQFYNAIGDSAAYDREVFQALAHDNLEIDTKLAILKSYIHDMYADSVAQPRIDNLFEVLIDLHPHERDIHDMYARYLIIKKEYAQAAEQEELALDLDPSDNEGWMLLTSLYFQTENLDKAAESLIKAEKFFPEMPEIYLQLGIVDTQKKNYPAALKQFDRALSLVDSAELDMIGMIYAAKADAHYATQQVDSAARYYQLAMTYRPDNAVTMNNYAYMLACEGSDLDLALELVENSLKADPTQSSTLDTHAWVLFKRKDYAKAKEAIDEALEKTEEKSAEVFEHAGDIYFMNGLPDEAVELWKEALKLDPDNELLRRKVKNKTYFYK